MNLRTLERSVARYQGSTGGGDGTVRGTTGKPKGPAVPTRNGWRDRPGEVVTWAKRPRRPDVERVQLPAVVVKPSTWWSRAKAAARSFARRVAP